MHRRWITLVALLQGAAPLGCHGASVVGGGHYARSDGGAAALDGPSVIVDTGVERRPPELRGSFDVTRNFFGPQRRPLQTTLGDCNGDGLMDLLRFEEGTLHVQTEGGAFRRQMVPFGGTSATFVDVDGDGRQDLLDAARELTLQPGNGDCTFRPAVTLGVACPAGGAKQILATDVDLDGVPDFAVVCRGSGSPPLRVFLGRGDGSYEVLDTPVTPMVPPPSDDLAARGYKSFGVYFEDFDGDGARDLAMMIDTRAGWFSRGQPGLLPRFVRDDAFSEDFAGADPMGLTLFDYDRDGRMDFFISGSRLYQNQGNGAYVDQAWPSGIGHGPDEVTSYVHWTPFALDVDFDGWTDLLISVKGGMNEDVVFPTWPSLFINRHDGTFVDVGRELVHVPLASEMMVCGDLASDGRVGCFVGDPAETALIYNHITPAGRWIGARLRGTVSAPDATGAEVSLDGEARPLVVVAGGQSPVYGEHARDVLLAAGQRDRATLLVTWPSGIRQRVPDLPTLRYNALVEPAAVTLSSRVAAPDGRQQIDVALDPAAVGARTATLELEGAGTWQGPLAAAADGRLHRLLIAPSAEGVARLTVAFDGTPLRIHPKVRFYLGAAAAPGG